MLFPSYYNTNIDQHLPLNHNKLPNFTTVLLPENLS